LIVGSDCRRRRWLLLLLRIRSVCCSMRLFDLTVLEPAVPAVVKGHLVRASRAVIHS
jgi:hypothetical protein